VEQITFVGEQYGAAQERFVLGMNENECKALAAKADALIADLTERWPGQGANLPKGGWVAVGKNNRNTATKIYDQMKVPERFRTYRSVGGWQKVEENEWIAKCSTPEFEAELKAKIASWERQRKEDENF
jgi:hypothetical protein